MRTIRFCCIAILCALVSASTARAQQQQSQDQDQNQGPAARPIPAYHSPFAWAADNGDADPDPQKLEPDTRSLAGAQDFSLGIPMAGHSYWQPHMDISSTGDSNPLKAGNQTGWTTFTSFAGGIDVRRTAPGSDLTLSYLGAGTVSNDGDGGNSITQELELNEKLLFRRTVISFIDKLDYLPEAYFGYGGGTALSLPGGGSLGLQGGLGPGDTILTTRGQRISNEFLTELEENTTPRSSFTFVGGYSVLHYFDNNFLDYGDAVFQAGYNYKMSREDTFAALYRFNAYRYSNVNQSINDHIVQVSYGRRITGELAFQVAAGPEIALLQLPLSGASGSTSTPANSTQVGWSLNTSLNYQLRRTALNLTYSHGLSGGSGILAGSTADTVSGYVTRQVTRKLGAQWNLGYSRNRGLAVAGVTSPAAQGSQTFDYWFTGLNLNHPLGRALKVFLSYQLQYQNSNAAFCVGATCQSSFVRHLVSAGFSWHDHPIAF